MIQQPAEYIESIVESQLCAMFEAYGIELERITSSKSMPPSVSIAGLIGFTSDSMRGTLMIASTFALMSRSLPPEVRTHQLSEHVARDWLQLRDWAAELANQLLGRVKNRLIVNGVTLRVATPTALSGAALAVATPRSARTHPVSFANQQDQVWLFWDALVDPTLELTEPSGETAANEGELLLFLPHFSPPITPTTPCPK